MNNVAILYTTFLRNGLAFKTIQSIQPTLSDNISLFIGDQNANDNKINPNPNWHFTFVTPLEFDCGLSASRNYLVEWAKITSFKYCLITADSIQFDYKYNFTPIIEFMEKNNVDKVGFQLKNRVKWEFDLALIPEKCFYLSKAKESPIVYNNIQYQKVDICKNFFIATTESLMAVPWDNNLKLLEHEDWSLRYKQAGYKTYATDYISATYINEKPAEYLKYRQRMYSEFQELLRKKYNLSGWVEYEEGLFD